MDMGRALVSGLAGAAAVTLLNEGARQAVPHAPRMDVIGMRALRATADAAGLEAPEGERLYGAAIAGDLLSNAIYYSAVARGDGGAVWLRGAALGLMAGLGAALLPQRIGLGRQPGEQAPTTHLLTVAWYLAGGLAAAAAAQAWDAYHGGSPRPGR